MIGLLGRFVRKPKCPTESEVKARDSFPEHLLRSARTKPLARVELIPATEPTQALLGPCTVAKVTRPGDSGPVLYMYHVLVAPTDWPALPYGKIRELANAMGVETGDLTKAVDALCGVR